jgi:formate--tetrahydrofolate ligase
MAILCLASSLKDLKARLGRIVVAQTRDLKPVTATDLKAEGAMTALLRDAIKPNLVQTLENNPALIHGGPFANIAHGCNTVIATRAALKMADWVVTEAGFGADLGAEKFIDIKCRQSGLRPAAVVLVASIRALKYHGGVDAKSLKAENLAALDRGFANLERHVQNIREVYGMPCVVSVNHFLPDTDAERARLAEKLDALNVPWVEARHWAEGGRGAEGLARAVVQAASSHKASPMRFVYDDDLPLIDKVRAVAQRVYRASDISADAKVRAQLQRLQEQGHGRLPVCIAKTPYSFSGDPALRGAATDHVLDIRKVRLAAGAEFVVAICGEILTMPGLPAEPASMRIDVDESGRIIGLF